MSVKPSAADAEPDWLNDLASLLQRQVDASPSACVTLDVATLGQQWQWPVHLVSDAVSDAALLAGLAVGVVDADTLDIMTLDAAQAMLDDGVEVDEINVAQASAHH